jgi:hypothetical protein
MSETVVYDSAKRAAAYWAKSLRNRARFLRSIQGTVANKRRVILLSDSQKKAINQEAIAAYETSLAELISEEIKKTGTCKIITGFGADGILIKAAERVGYEVSMLAVEYETTMTVTETEVVVNSVHKRTQI